MVKPRRNIAPRPAAGGNCGCADPSAAMMRRKLAPHPRLTRKVAPPMPLALASVDHVLTTTRSVRRRLALARPVEPEVIEECLRLAIQAPTGGNSQGWRWIVVTDAGLRLRLPEASPHIPAPPPPPA